MFKTKEENKFKQSSIFEKVTQSIILSSPKIILTFGVGHPFDLIKTKMQANPKIHSGILLAHDIYKKNGVKGFYFGGVPNFGRSFFKDTYRNPLRGYLNAEYGNICSQNMITRDSLTAFSMAFTDTFIFCPLERIKVWLMTNEKKESIVNIFSNEKKRPIDLMNTFFKGATISFGRESISWLSFLIPERIIYDYVTQQKDSNVSNLTLFEKVAVGGLSGMINNICTLPFDTIKTNIQKVGYNEKVSFRNMCDIGKNLITEYGFCKGLYPGFLTRLIHYSIVGIITSDIMHRVDEIWQPKIEQNNLMK